MVLVERALARSPGNEKPVRPGRARTGRARFSGICFAPRSTRRAPASWCSNRRRISKG